MQRSHTLWIGVTLGFLTGALAVFLSILLAAGGHGSYVAAKILFPITMISTSMFQSITVPFVVVALIQFPLYGLYLGIGSRQKNVSRSALILGGTHLALALISFLMPNSYF